jgi:co-chaperonin GroES (HSP10)
MLKGKVTPIRDNVLVSDMDFDTRTTKGGIFLLNDDGKTEGIRPRWGRVWAVGDEQKHLKVGEWVLVEHGRWTRGITVESDDGHESIIRRIDNDCILAVADERPSEF